MDTQAKVQAYGTRKLVNFYTFAALLSLVLVPVAAKNEPVFVELSVEHNRREIRPPDHVTLTVGDHSVDVAVRDGKFEVPEQTLNIKSDSLISFRATIGSDQIQLLDMPRGSFDHRWTVILEDHKFKAEYQSFLKGSEARSACAIVFSAKPHPEDTQFVIRDSTFLVAPHCRTPLKK